MTKRILVLLAVLAGALASGTVSAHGRARVHFGVHLGAPLFWGYPYYAPPPPYYYAPVYHPAPAYYPASPPVYVEREGQAQEAPPQSWWYYCEQTRSYYPYVKSCPGGWQRVPPTPSSQGSPQ
jgi:hypothetical protein